MSISTNRSTTIFNQSREIIESKLACTEEVDCPLCRLTHPGVVSAKRIFGVDYQGFELAECLDCGFRFLSKRPSRENLIAAIYETYWDEDRESLRSSHRIQEIENQIAKIQSFMNVADPFPNTPLRVLDVGCGNGLFLEQARRQGWEATGTEITPAVCAGLRERLKVPIYEGFLPDIQFDAEPFDVIRMNQVLEHAFDPIGELQACKKWLKPKGILFISVPNAGSFQYFLKDLQSRFHLKKNPYKHYAALHHFWFFTPLTARKLCALCGFAPIHWESRVPPRPAMKSILSKMYCQLLGWLGVATIQDIYCRKENGS